MRRVKPTTTKPRARQPMPPSRKESGVEPPATAATPPVLSCMAMAGDRTEMLMATASMVRSEPRANSPAWLCLAVVVAGASAGPLLIAIYSLPSGLDVLSHPPGDVDAGAGDV